jgi:hypothetical protein
MHKCGLTFARSIVRTDPWLSKDGIVKLKNALQRVLQGSYSEESASLALLMLAELGHKNYDLVLGNNILYAL